jgi:hypothetical protein
VLYRVPEGVMYDETNGAPEEWLRDQLMFVGYWNQLQMWS